MTNVRDVRTKRHPAAQSDPSLPPAEVMIWGGIALAEPSLPELERELTYCRAQFEEGGPVGYRCTNTEVSLYSHDHRGRLAFPAGLARRVAEVFGRTGYSVTLTDHRRLGRRHRPDAAVLEAASGDGKAFMEAVAREPVGQVEVRGTRDAVRRVRQVFRLFPEARVVVAVATRRRARGLRRMLRGVLREPVGVACGASYPADGRVVVTTFRYLNTFPPGRVDVLLLADAGELAGEVAKETLGHTSHSPKRVYAFVPTGRRLGPAAQLCVEAMAGRLIYRPGPEPTDVRVLVGRGMPAAAVGPAEGLERKRRGVWRNEPRNTRVARTAMALAGRKPADLSRLGFTLTAVDAAWLRQSDLMKVVVLVETAEHARGLRHYLPGWPVLSLADGREDEQRAAAGPAGGQPRQIVTLAYSVERGVDADVLVRADGGTFPLRLRGFPRPKISTAAADGKTFLVDFDDDFDHRARRDTRQRLGGYAQQGWLTDDCNRSRINTAEPTQGLAPQFPTPVHGEQGRAENGTAEGRRTSPPARRTPSRRGDEHPGRCNPRGHRTHRQADPSGHTHPTPPDEGRKPRHAEAEAAEPPGQSREHQPDATTTVTTGKRKNRNRTGKGGPTQKRQ